MGQWNNDAQVMLGSEPTLIHDLANHMGYNFVLKNVTLSTANTNAQATTISLSWHNSGVSYLYKPASVAVALLDSANNVVQKQWFTGSNPRAWAPGQTTTENATLAFQSADISKYKLAVGLFQNTTDSNPTYRIGNQGRTANGWYVVSTNPTATSTPCHLLFTSQSSLSLNNVCQRSRKTSVRRI